MNDMSTPRPRRNDDGLGPTSDIGARLRALFGAVQDEPVPDREELIEIMGRHGQTVLGPPLPPKAS